MKKLNFFLLIAAQCSIFSSLLFADGFNKAGRTAFQFLKIGVGARQAALGEASIASVRDVNSIFWNPANISGVQTGEASFSFSRWFAEMNYFAGAACFRLKEVGVFGLSYSMLDYGKLQESLTPVVGGSSDSRTGSTFGGHDLQAGLSYSREFTDRLSIGGSVKLLQEKLWIYTVSTMAYDVGTNYDIGYRGMRLAMSAQNFGSTVKWLENSDRDEGYDIPLVYRIGLSFNLLQNTDGFLSAGEQHQLMVDLEAVHTNDFGDRFNFGGEYTYKNLIALRGGYRANYDNGDFSFGVGLMQRLSSIDLRVDFSYTHYQYLNSPYRLTLLFAF